jgi:hypothetical protein
MATTTASGTGARPFALVLQYARFVVDGMMQGMLDRALRTDTMTALDKLAELGVDTQPLLQLALDIRDGLAETGHQGMDRRQAAELLARFVFQARGVVGQPRSHVDVLDTSKCDNLAGRIAASMADRSVLVQQVMRLVRA